MKPECSLIGKDGNVFNLLGIVRNTLKMNCLYTQLELFDIELKDLQEKGGKYDDVLVLIMKYVEIV